MMSLRFLARNIDTNKARICRGVLDLLPAWFAVEEAKEAYIRGVEELPMLGCFDDATGDCLGFVSLKDSSPNATEIFVMGVYPDFHRYGVGTFLLQQVEERERKVGKEFLFVKTLSSTHPDLHYAKTRQFYAKFGFKDLAVLPMIWGEENPCLIMVKKI